MHFRLETRFPFHQVLVVAGQFLFEELEGLCGPALEPMLELRTECSGSGKEKKNKDFSR